MADEVQQNSLPESQKERWIKYGANVALVTIVAIILAGLITYLAQRTNRRIDTTASGDYSLKPQTVNLIKDNKSKIKLVSLYTAESRDEKDRPIKSPYAERVADLLEEYRRKGSNIDVQTIDPVANPKQVDDLVGDAINKYGGQVKAYADFVNDFKKTLDELKTLAANEATAASKLSVDKLGNSDRDADIASLIETIQKRPAGLDSRGKAIDRELKERHPDYKKVTESIQQAMEGISESQDRILQYAEQYKSDNTVPQDIRTYLADSIPRQKEMKAKVDDVVKKLKGLGELKVADLQEQLKGQDLILVEGEKEWRVLGSSQVWPPDDAQMKQYVPGQQLKRRFAGEQQVTSAILALSQDKKQKLCFVRTGGPPMTNPGMMPFQRGGPMATVAERLRQYNFDVQEKDLSGMWAMQAQMQQMPSPPEPSDEQIKDAIWVVLNFPTAQQQPGMPPAQIGPKVAEHLKNGGSALILFAPQADNPMAENMSDLMKEWGLEVHPEAIAVHQLIKTTEGRQVDMIEDALKYPFVFDIRDYGDHLITRPLRSLASMFLPLSPVKVLDKPPAGVKVTPIIPLPKGSWGETDIEALQNLNDVKYDEGKDVGGSIYGGAVAEKDKAGRLVVIASPMFAFDRWVNEPDPNLIRRGLIASRFPANAELFNNSIFWLAKMEPMIAISPAAMEVARIEPMGEGTLQFWKVGGLLVILPGLVVAAGLMVYFARRD